MALNSKQQLFADGIIAGKTATQAATDAGYSADTAYSQGSRLLKNAEIQQTIQQAQSQVTTRVIETTALTRERILSNLDQVLMLALADKKLSPALKALELQGKTLGIWSEPETTDTNLAERLKRARERAKPKA